MGRGDVHKQEPLVETTDGSLGKPPSVNARHDAEIHRSALPAGRFFGPANPYRANRPSLASRD